jgi:hypothetical protein
MLIESDQVHEGSELSVYREECHFQGRGIQSCKKVEVGDAVVEKILPNGEAEISTTAPVRKHDFLESH